MKTPGRGDKSFDLFKQLVAAMLNVEAGNEAECIEDTIADANALLQAHPAGSGLRARDPAWRDTGGELHGTLDDYNNGALCAAHRG